MIYNVTTLFRTYQHFCFFSMPRKQQDFIIQLFFLRIWNSLKVWRNCIAWLNLSILTSVLTMHRVIICTKYIINLIIRQYARHPSHIVASHQNQKGRSVVRLLEWRGVHIVSELWYLTFHCSRYNVQSWKRKPHVETPAGRRPGTVRCPADVVLPFMALQNDILSRT